MLHGAARALVLSLSLFVGTGFRSSFLASVPVLRLPVPAIPPPVPLSRSRPPVTPAIRLPAARRSYVQDQDLRILGLRFAPAK
ncbi:hypothetical protein GCM10027176_53310 [Actinoallomurus bryophytorum]